VLSTLKITKGFIEQFSRKWGSKFWGACHFGGTPYIRTAYIAFCRGLWAVNIVVEILSKSTSGPEIQGFKFLGFELLFGNISPLDVLINFSHDTPA